MSKNTASSTVPPSLPVTSTAAATPANDALSITPSRVSPLAADAPAATQAGLGHRVSRKRAASTTLTGASSHSRTKGKRAKGTTQSANASPVTLGSTVSPPQRLPRFNVDSDSDSSGPCLWRGHELHSDEEQSQLPEEYVIRRMAKATRAKHRAQATKDLEIGCDKSRSDDSNASDQSNAENTPSESEEEAVEIVAGQLTAETASWTVAMPPVSLKGPGVQTPSPVMASGATSMSMTKKLTRSRGSESKREKQHLAEQPKWSSSVHHDGGPHAISENFLDSTSPGPGCRGHGGGHGETRTPEPITTVAQALVITPLTRSPSHGAPMAVSTVREDVYTCIALTPPPTNLNDHLTYNIVYPAGRGALSLLAQSEIVRKVIRAAVLYVEKSTYTVNGLPNALQRAAIIRKALLDSANMAAVPIMAQRIQGEAKYRKDLSSMVSQRLSNEHFYIKTKADNMVPSMYGLQVSPSASDTMVWPLSEIVDWLSNDLMFIYICNAKEKTYQAHKPFSHPIVVSLLRAIFFIGPDSRYLRHQDIFISSVADKDEREVPMVMLALTCAMIFIVIREFESGDHKRIEFSYDTANDTYLELLQLLTEIKRRKPLAYHKLMSGIFNECIGATKQKPPSQAINVVDIDGMDE
ncbi:hypothetical protein JVU11DRAFT_2949 [Chiua virens]|nr:hypothetical protein JVU11DRAFT_2949 [Chiua virens]